MSFESLGIEKNAVKEDLYQTCQKADLAELLQPVLKGGSCWINEQGKIQQKYTLNPDSPWIYTVPDSRRQCNFCMPLFADKLNMFPYLALSCWKVVVKPENVLGLFDLLRIQNYFYSGPGKCGIEVRPSVPVPYGGYFYNDTLEAGQECFKTVKALVDRHIRCDAKVILKRGCTELEQIWGDSRNWDSLVSGDLEELQKTVISLFAPTPSNTTYPDWIKAHIIRRWVQFAHQRGDFSYLSVTEGKRLYADYVTYHESVEE